MSKLHVGSVFATPEAAHARPGIVQALANRACCSRRAFTAPYLSRVHRVARRSAVFTATNGGGYVGGAAIPSAPVVVADDALQVASAFVDISVPVAAATSATVIDAIVPDWTIWVGLFFGIFPFGVALYEFSKRIIIQQRCASCGGSGLELIGGRKRKCRREEERGRCACQ